VLVSARRISLVGLVSLCVSCGCLALACAPALAGPLHPLLGQFGSFSNVQGVAVDQDTGDVFVYDGRAGVVYKFSASGAPEEFSHTKTNAITVSTVSNGEGEIAVDSSSGPAKGDIYVAHGRSNVLVFDEAGEQVGELTEAVGHPWGEACGVAVDASGNVYVGLYSNHVDRYTPSANPVTNADYSGSLYGADSVCNVAADSTGNVYVDTWEKGPVTKFEASQFNLLETPGIGTPVTPGGSTLAVDPSTNELYVDERHQVVQFNASGGSVDTFGSGAISESYGVAVDDSTHDVFVSDGAGQVDVYGALGLYAPLVESESVSDVAAESASLQAQVNPNEEETTYRFEYGTSEAYGQSTPESSSIGAGGSGISVLAHIQGLQAATTYHYRVVATNAIGQSRGADHTFTTQGRGGSFALPDGRQYEMVTSPEKLGAHIESISEQFGLIEAAANGDALTYVSASPTESEGVGFADTVQNLSVRGSVGWRSRGLTVPHSTPSGPSVGLGPEYRAFSSDLSDAIVQPLGKFTPCMNIEGAPQPCMSPEASEQTAFLSTDFFDGNVEEPCLQASRYCARPLVSGCPKAGEPCPRVVEEHADVPPGAIFGYFGGAERETTSEEVCVVLNGKYCGPQFVAATPDLSHILLKATAQLTPEAPSPAGGNLWEWASGHLTYVGNGGNPRVGVDPMSVDGSRVVFGGSYGGLKGLLMRDPASGEAVQVGGADAQFQAMSSDGSRVFFDEGANPDGEGGELEVFETAGGSSGPLAGTVTSLTGSAGLLGYVVGVSEDGSYVYFVSGSVIAGSGATGPGRNLYVDHYTGSEWKPSFITMLSTEDGADWAQETVRQPTRVSPNGQWLAFLSSAALTGYDNHDAVNGRPDAEVFLYRAGGSETAATLTCASCDPTGQRPTGLSKGEFGSTEEFGEMVNEYGMVAADVPGWQQTGVSDATSEQYQSRYLSDSGRLFFNSEGPLVPDDVDGTQDVYEYEPEGVGSCSSSSSSGSVVFEPARGFEVDGRGGEQAAGCVGLISAGTSSESSSFLDASQNGSDVFFRTISKLVSQDEDTAADIYDARECTGASSCPSALVSTPQCETEASCRPSPAPQPAIYSAPPSATFSGPGDITAPTQVAVKVAKKSLQCGKGFVKKHDRCVRKKLKRAKRVGRHGRAGR
jgi:hypothetical protein